MRAIYMIVLVFNFIFSAALSQNFYVVKVEGKITSSNSLLKTGDKLTSESEIHFAGKDDKIYLLSPSGGYFVLSPSIKEVSEESLAVVLKNAIIPQNKFYYTASRGDNNSFGAFEDIYDLMGFFRNKVLIIDEGKFKVNLRNIPLDDRNFFEFKNLTNDKELTFKSNSEYFFLSGNISSSKFEMSYNQPDGMQKIGTFLLSIKTRKEILDELSVFFKNNDLINSAGIFTREVLPYISEAYGNTDIDIIRDIITTDLKIPIQAAGK